MKFTYEWLKEYCPCELTPGELTHLLPMRGIQVEEYHSVGDDICFELEITANRADCLSVIGIAREVALLTNQKMSLPRIRLKESFPKTRREKLVRIEVKDLCPSYIARVIKGIKCGPSPAWLRKRIEAVGLRSINNIVDITNFVMLESGQPLHAFDLNQLNGHKIIVRLAKKGEKILAIDDEEYELTPEMMVIADAYHPVAIAGVMGGKLSEVKEGTTNILLESAFFEPISIRKTSRRLKLSSDSSYRFERGINPSGIEWASRRASALIKEIAGGEIVSREEIGHLRIKKNKLSLRWERINKILGIEIDKQEVKKILKGLGFILLKEWKGQIEVLLPLFRNDLKTEIDVIEEIARIHGYDQIPTNPPLITLNVLEKNRIDEIGENVREILTSLGYTEILTPSWVDEKYRGDFPYWSKEKAVTLVNPEGIEDKLLRNNIVSSLLVVNQTNEKYKSDEKIQLFEIAKVYYRNKNNNVTERFCLGLLDNTGFYALKGTVTNLLERLRILDKVKITASGDTCFHNQQAVKLVIDDKPLGYLGELNSALREKYETVKNITVAELDFELLTALGDTLRVVKDFPRLPATRRDLAVVVNEQITWAEIEDCVLKQGGNFLEKVEFFDLYRGGQITTGKKSIAFSMLFRAPDRTLTNEEVDLVISKIVQTLNTSLSATLRT